ncbi:hypothetical protein Pcinc_022097 [Petrolisthes cinctipes]|uniref:Apple domain-containing protein n=1 Tax=Petrolisthes cinctipes TaxID=88211 RepID=A0AAE1KHC7_PETCI|nr:hypothetical protein Pcinc_022097 [Petrolisthes cinctipes]
MTPLLLPLLRRVLLIVLGVMMMVMMVVVVRAQGWQQNNRLPELVGMVEMMEGERTFFVVSSYTFPVRPYNDTVITNTTSCKCRNACLVSGERCVSWSLVDGSECRLSSQPLDSLSPTLQPHANATFYFWQKSTEGRYWWGQDNLLYMEAKTSMNILDAWEHCAAFPGHRLVIFKTTQQREILSQFESTNGPLLALNLMKTPDGPVWGDNTTLADTALNTPDILSIYGDANIYFVWFKNKMVNTNNVDRLRKAVCQVNPYHVAW